MIYYVAVVVRRNQTVLIYTFTLVELLLWCEVRTIGAHPFLRLSFTISTANSLLMGGGVSILQPTLSKSVSHLWISQISISDIIIHPFHSLEFKKSYGWTDYKYSDSTCTYGHSSFRCNVHENIFLIVLYKYDLDFKVFVGQMNDSKSKHL